MATSKRSTGTPPPDDAAASGGSRRLELFNQHRELLFSISYRMLGSVADSEDILQETFIRWQQTADVDIKSPRAYLVTILTRLCLNYLESAQVRRQEYYGQWLPEPLLTDLSDPVSKALEVPESLSMAFLVLLERLSPMERGVFLLREVFDYDFAEVGQILGQTEANCRQVLHRARQHVAENRPRFDTSVEHRERLMKEFMIATSGGDLQRLVAMLSKDAILHSDGGGKGPALPKQIFGAEKVARAVVGGSRKFVPKTLTHRMRQINGELGVVSYLEGRPHSVFTVDIVGGQIRNIYIVSNPEKLAHLPFLS
jgi:RNA polymerase sigma-70 factor (ECF subfamily)